MIHARMCLAAAALGASLLSQPVVAPQATTNAYGRVVTHWMP